MRRPTIRHYNVLVWPQGSSAPDAYPSVLQYTDRNTAEASANDAFAQFPRGKVQVWAIPNGAEGQGWLVYELAPGYNGLRLVTRLQARLRRAAPVTDRQYRALETLQQQGPWVAELVVRHAIGAYATHCLLSLQARGWMQRHPTNEHMLALTAAGVEVLEQLADGERQVAS